MTTIAKPPYGSPCNGCGHCCREELCPLGVAVFAMIDGPCPALGAANSGWSQAFQRLEGASAGKKFGQRGTWVSAREILKGEVE